MLARLGSVVTSSPSSRLAGSPRSDCVPLLGDVERHDLLDIVIEQKKSVPCTLEALAAVSDVVRDAGPDTSPYADLHIIVPTEPFTGESWHEVPQWTAFTVSRAFVYRASPVLGRILKDHAARGRDNAPIIEFCAAAHAACVRPLLAALYGATYTPTLADAVEMRALLQFWCDPEDTAKAPGHYAPVWEGILQACGDVVERHLCRDNAESIFRRARCSGDEETERLIARRTGTDAAFSKWLMGLDGGSLFYVLDHPACGMRAQGRLQILLEWADARGFGDAPPQLDEALHALMDWDNLSPADVHDIGLASLVRAVDLGLLDASVGFRVLRHIHEAALPPPARRLPTAVPVLPQPLEPQVVVPQGEQPRRARAAHWRVPLAMAANVAANAITAGAAVTGGAAILWFLRGDKHLAGDILKACWVGAAYGVFETGLAHLIWLANGLSPSEDLYATLAQRQVISGVALGPAFGLGAALGGGAGVAVTWPFIHGEPCNGLGVCAAVGAGLLGSVGVGFKLWGLASSLAHDFD